MTARTIKEYISILKQDIHPLPSYIQEVISFVNQSHEAISDFKFDRSVQETPKEVLKLAEITQRYGDFLVAFSKNINNFKPVYCATPDETIEKDLEYIKSNTTDFCIDGYDGSKILFSKNIIMSDVYRDIKHDFGFFKFIMRKDRVYMTKLSGNTERNGQYHPYQTADKVCLGSYKDPYTKAMESNNFYVAYTLLMGCLTVYGGDDLKGVQAGPQNPIELWIGQVCSVCDSQVLLEDIQVCGKTNRVICPNCVDSGSCTDEVNNEIYHPDVLKSCSSCGKTASTVIRGVCYGCREKAVVGV